MSISDASATEGASVSFTISLDAVSGRAVKVKWQTGDDSSEGAVQATADTDYTSQALTEVTIAAGATSKTVTVATTEDVIDEADETFLVQLSDATNAKLSTTAASATGTITDDDAAPTSITLSVDADTSLDNVQTGVAEEGGAKTVRVTATVDGSTTFNADTTVIVKVGNSGDTAVEGTDYDTVGDLTIKIPAGQRSASADFTLTPTNDTLDEDDEAISIKGSSGTLAFTNTQITIEDDDGAPLSITLSVDADIDTVDVQSSVAEDGGAKTVRVTATVDGSTTFNTDTTVNVAVGKDGDSAVEGTDYTTVGALSITISAGQRSAYVDFTLTPTNDTLDEDTEMLSITGSSGDLSFTDTSVSITDDDTPPTVSVGAASAPEGTAVSFTISLDAASGREVKVKWNTADDSTGSNPATADTDYTAQTTATEVTIAAGSTSTTVTVDTTEDVIDEADETFLVELSDPTHATVSGTGGSATGTITDDDGTPSAITLTVDADTATADVQETSVIENGGAKTVRVTATVDGSTRFNSDMTVTVKIGETGDTAEEATDYSTVADQTITISAGQRSGYADFELTPTDDSLDEDDESLSLVGSSSGSLSFTNAAITIEDDDAEPTVSVSDATATEGGQVSFMISLDVVSGRAVKVKWATADHTAGTHKATADTDYTSQALTEVTIAAGATSKTVTVATTEDVIDEADETFLVQLSDATNAKLSTTAASATGTITDDDGTPTALTLSVDADTGTNGTQSSVAEDGGAKTARITATITGGTTFSTATVVTVAVGDSTDTATEGTDYSTVNALTITIPAGQASAYVDFTLTPTNDSLNEEDEIISIGATSGSLTVTGTQITIEDDDNAPSALTLSVDADTGTDNIQSSVTENGGAKTARVTATINGGATFPTATVVTVEVGKNTDTATEGVDYTTVGSLTITIPAGQPSAHTDFTLTPTDDDLDEDNEKLTITGSSGSLTVTATGVTIEDDDPTPQLTIDDVKAVEGSPMEFTITLDAVSGRDVIVKWQTADDSEATNPATADTDYTAQATAQTVTIAAGQTEAIITVNTIDDNQAEPQETFLIRLTSPTNATLSDSEATGTIQDNDVMITTTSLITITPPILSLGPSAPHVFEGESQEFTIYATQAPAQELTVNVNIKDHHGVLAAADRGPRTITLPPNKTSASFTLDTLDDDIDNNQSGSRWVTVRLLPGQNYELAVDPYYGAPFEGFESSLFVHDDEWDDLPARVVYTEYALYLTEGGDKDGYGVRLTKQPEANVVVEAATRDPGAALISIDGGQETTLVRLTFTPSNWNVRQRIMVIPKDDADGIHEETQIRNTIVESGSIYKDVVADWVSVFIIDDDAQPLQVTISPDSQGAVTEGTAARFTLTTDPAPSVWCRSPWRPPGPGCGPNETLTVSVRVADDPNGDFLEADLEGDKTFEIPSSGTAVFSVDTKADNQDEPNGTITVTVLDGAGYDPGTPGEASITVEDNEATAVELSAAAGDIPEGGSKTLVVTLARPLVASESLTVPLVFGGDATPGDDYTLDCAAATGVSCRGLSGNNPKITFTGKADASPVARLTLRAAEDDLAEDRESVTVAFGALDGDSGKGLGGGASGSGSVAFGITDGAADPVLSASAPSVTEGEPGAGARLTFTVRLASAHSETVTVNYADTGDGTATDGSDYTAPTAGTLTFTPGQTQQVVTVSVLGDHLDEEDETVIIRLSAPANATLAGGASKLDVAGTITDDDERGINVSPAALTLEEPDGAGTYEVTLTSRPTAAVIVDLTSSDTSAATVEPSSLTFQPAEWNTPQTVTVKAVDDQIPNPDGGRIATIAHSVAASTSDYGTETAEVSVTVTDDDEPGLSIMPTTLMVPEGSQASYMVSLTMEPAGMVTVKMNGHVNSDLTLDKTSLTFSTTKWNEMQMVTVSAAHDDDDLDDSEMITLIATGGGYDEMTADVEVTVTDDDRADPALVISEAALTMTEGAEASYTVSLSTKPADTVTVTISGYVGTDLTLDTESLTFTPADWDEPQPVTVSADPDADEDEDTATLVHTASDSSYGTASLPVTVRDGIKISLDVGKAIEGDFMEVRFTLSSPAPGNVEVSWLTHPGGGSAHAGSIDNPIDFRMASGRVRFTAGETEITRRVWIVDDDVDDPHEKFTVWILNPVGAVLAEPVTSMPSLARPDVMIDLGREIAYAVVTILEAESPPEPVKVKIEATTPTLEEGGYTLVRVTLAEPLPRHVRIPLVWSGGTAEPGDYEGPSGLTIYAGSVSATVMVKASEDDDQDNETFSVSFGELPEWVVAGSSDSVQIEIVDND
ncbi:MAG: hypothetical protein F4Z41_10115 [Acidimicrobiia bacterium]|nr:hypothetical protein [Acidimicrobiia bacterium]